MPANKKPPGRRARRPDWPLFTRFTPQQMGALRRDFGFSGGHRRLFIRLTETDVRWFNAIRRAPHHKKPELIERLLALFSATDALHDLLRSHVWLANEDAGDIATRNLLLRGLERSYELIRPYEGPLPTFKQLLALPGRLFPLYLRKKGAAAVRSAYAIGAEIGQELAYRSIIDVYEPDWKRDDGARFIHGMIAGFARQIGSGAWEGWLEIEQWDRKGAGEDYLMRQFIQRLHATFRFMHADKNKERAAFTRYVALALEAGGEQPRSISKVRDLVTKYIGKAGSLNARNRNLSWAERAAKRKAP